MARKDLLKGLMEAPAEPATGLQPDPESRVDAARPRYSSGAIGAVSQSIADLKARSVIEVDPRMIDSAGLQDRLDEPTEAFEALKASLDTYGQQVPVLLRVNPNDPERFEVVYGRRRIAALKALNTPVKAMVRHLNDADLIMAQGQENAARRDLSFIEKANFARAMRDAGYERKAICDALHTDKTLISRLLSITDAVPLPLIEAIGAAPGIGRDRWLLLARRIGTRDLVAFAQGDTSDARFEAVMTALAAPRSAGQTSTPTPDIVTAPDGTELAQIARKGGRLTIQLAKDAPGEFGEWLAGNLGALHDDWLKSKG